MVRDSFEDFEVNDETLTGADSQLVETFVLEYGGIYNSSEGSDTDRFTDLLSYSNNLLLLEKAFLTLLKCTI